MGRTLTEAEHERLKAAGWDQAATAPTFEAVAVDAYTTLACPKLYFQPLPDGTWLVYEEPIRYVEGVKPETPVGVVYKSPEDAICATWVAAKARL